MSSSEENERACKLHRQLESGIGKKPMISEGDFKWLMNNQHLISPKDKAAYITKIIRFLNSGLHKIPEIPGKDANAGDRLEYFLGIPNNPLKMGDLYGLDLKSMNIGGSDPLRVATLTFLVPARKHANGELGCNYPQKEHSIVYYPKYKKYRRPESARPPFLCKTGEKMTIGKENSFGRMRFDFDSENNLKLSIRKARKDDWSVVTSFPSQPFAERLDKKISMGILLVWYRVRRGRRIDTIQCLYLPNLDTKRVISDLKEGNLGLAVRFKGGKSPRSTGSALEYTRSQLNSIIHDEPEPSESLCKDWKFDAEKFSK